MSNKVDFKTNILEFKRKHNNLVDDLPEIIEEQIEGDNDIISKITFSEGKIVFPEGIAPIKVKLEDNEGHSIIGYVNYGNYSAMNPMVTIIVLSGSGISISSTSATKISSLSYIKFNGTVFDAVGEIKTSNLFTTIPTAVSVNEGTPSSPLMSVKYGSTTYGLCEIYRHKVTITDGTTTVKIDIFQFGDMQFTINTEAKLQNNLAYENFIVGHGDGTDLAVVLSYDKTAHKLYGITKTGTVSTITFTGTITVSDVHAPYYG